MKEGRDGAIYLDQVLLAGIFNRLGDGKSKPVKIDPPAHLTKKRVAAVKEEIALARALFEQYVGQRQGNEGRAP